MIGPTTDQGLQSSSSAGKDANGRHQGSMTPHAQPRFGLIAPTAEAHCVGKASPHHWLCVQQTLAHQSWAVSRRLTVAGLLY